MAKAKQNKKRPKKREDLEITWDSLINEKDFDFIKDYYDSIMNNLTEIEQDTIKILVNSKNSLTINKIRNMFTYSYLREINNYFLNNKYKTPNEETEIIDHYCDDFIHKHQDLAINYPKNLDINLNKALLLLRDIYFTKPDTPEKRSNAQRILLYETPTDFVERVRKVMSEYKLSIPSNDVIKPSLEYLKNKNIVEMRIQNNNTIWFVSPKFFILYKKIERHFKEREDK